MRYVKIKKYRVPRLLIGPRRESTEGHILLNESDIVGEIAPGDTLEEWTRRRGGKILTAKEARNELKNKQLWQI